MKEWLKDFAIVYGIIFGIIGFLTLLGLFPNITITAIIIFFGIFVYYDQKKISTS